LIKVENNTTVRKSTAHELHLEALQHLREGYRLLIQAGPRTYREDRDNLLVIISDVTSRRPRAEGAERKGVA
jgi:hypothetical protein